MTFVHCVLIFRTESSFVTENIALLIMLQLGHFFILFTPFMFVCLLLIVLLPLDM